MRRLRFCALAALVAAAFVAQPVPRAEAQGWFGDRTYREQPDEDYGERRARAYRRDAAARRSAREDSRRREPNFLERLFGGGREAEEDAPVARRRVEPSPGAVEVRPKARRVVRRKPPAAAGPALAATPSLPGAAPVLPGQTLVPGAPLPGEEAPPPAATPAVPAAPTTFVAVIGDSIADNLAFGLQEGFADAPELQVKRITKPNSGLVRADYFDFVPAVGKALEAGPITYAVIDVGVNDRQPFLDARKEPPLSEEWKRRYVERIDALLGLLKEKKIPVYWVGLAASGSRRASADHTAINALAKDRVEAAGGTYVDVWEGFVDEDGDYAESGPQLDGQIGRLRMDDGVHYSKAGARKLAHYVEQEIRKVFQPKPAPAPDAVVAAVAPDAAMLAPQPAPAAEKPRPISSPVMVLTASPRTANGALSAAGPATVPAREASDSAAKVLVKGEAGKAESGRLDDHRWPGAEQPLLDKATPVSSTPQPPAPPAPEAAALTDPKPIADQPAAPATPGR